MAGGGKSRKAVAAKQAAVTPAAVSVVCAICQETISDSAQDCEGQDSVFCEGPCQKWIHRTCAGLPIPAFTAIVKSTTPFHCFQCSLSAHATEIKELRSEMSQLSKELAEIKSRLVESRLEDCCLPTSSAANASLSSIATYVPVKNAAKLKEPLDVRERETRFNIVVSGLPECPEGMPRKTRVSKDENAILTAICKQLPSFSSLSIRDCVRLGKYKANSRPRPILVTLNKAADVARVLSVRFPQDGIRVRPDLSPAARKIRALLLAERRILIDGGTVEPKQIKLRGDCIYVGERLHGQIKDGTLMRQNPRDNQGLCLFSKAEPELPSKPSDSDEVHSPGNGHQDHAPVLSSITQGMSHTVMPHPQ